MPHSIYIYIKSNASRNVQQVIWAREEHIKMSHLQYYAYPGVGERNKTNFRYSQAVRIGDRIECAGQGQSKPMLKTKHFLTAR